MSDVIDLAAYRRRRDQDLADDEILRREKVEFLLSEPIPLSIELLPHGEVWIGRRGLHAIVAPDVETAVALGEQLIRLKGDR